MINITVDGVAYPVPSNAADTNWAADQVAFEQALVAYVDDVATALDWTAVSVLSNSWANVTSAQPLAYAKDLWGTVYIRGDVDSGSPGTEIFTLPSGYRPNKQATFVCGADSGLCKVLVLANGQVFIGAGIAGGDPTTQTNIYGVAFSTVTT